jgi:P63C domain
MDAFMATKKIKASGRAKGGEIAAANMSPEMLAERARKGGVARWGYKATHKGNFKAEFGIDAECYVLNDEQKTAVVTQSGMGEILGLGTGGSRLPRFVFNQTMSEYIGPDLREKIEKPFIFQILNVGQPTAGSVRAHGYDASVLIDICQAILKAKADGKVINPAVVAQAGIIVGASAKAGIQGLVYALAGFDRSRDEVVAAFKLFVAEEAREYEREFPPQLYDQWYRLYQLSKPERGRPWKAKSLTIDHVYYPLARSSGRVLELVRALKANGADRNKKLHQFLSDLGVKALRTQVGQLLGIAGIAKSQAEYEGHVKTLFGEQPDLPGIDPA